MSGPEEPTGGFPAPTDLKKPPPYIVGATGGPAGFTGSISISAEEKQEYSDLSDLFNLGAGFLAIGAAGTGAAGPEAWLLTAVLGVSAGAMVVLGVVGDDLAEDPPQPNYKRPVVFKQRVSKPPRAPDPIFEPLRIVIQQGVFATVTARGYLDAVERLKGAQEAGDTTWANIQFGTAYVAFRQLVADIANVAAALYDAGNSLKGSKFDVPLTPGRGSVKKWIGTKSTQTSLAAEMQSSGLTPSEIKQAISLFKSDPQYKEPLSTLSAQLMETAKNMHAIATKMNDIA